MPRHRSDGDGALPPLLIWLINAAKTSGSDAEGGDLGGAPNALRELAALASWALPIHGVFVPNNSDICLAINRVAKAHLGLDEPRRDVRKALKVIEVFQQRDAIESAYNQLRSVEDEAYYYTGLAFGIVLASLSTR